MCLFCKQEGEDATQFASRVKSAIALKGGLLDLEWWGSSTPHRPSHSFNSLAAREHFPVLCQLTVHPRCPCRDGGLKRQKVKDSYKEEQQKMYSSIIVRQNGHSPTKESDSTTDDTGGTGWGSWWSPMPLSPRGIWTGWPLLVQLDAASTLLNRQSLMFCFVFFLL